MKSYLTKYEPPGRAPCLCGSGIRFKNCCKKEYSKKRFNSRALFNKGEYTDALKSIRFQITWYRLCYMAHTVPFLSSKSDESKNLLRADIEALSDMTDLLLSCYEKCNIIEEFPKSLDYLKSVISDDRWCLKIDYHRCIYLYVYKNCKEKAYVILSQYDWRDLHDVDLLTVYIDIKSDDLNQADKINVAEKIYDLTDSPSIKLQYGNMVGIQYCLLNDFNKGIPLIEKAISDYEGTPEDKRSAIGKHHLSLSYKHLGELVSNDSYISKSVTGLEKEISTGEYSDLGYSQLLFDLGDCYSHLGELEKSITAYDKSIALNYSDLSLVFKSRVLIKLEDMDKAREGLNSARP